MSLQEQPVNKPVGREIGIGTMPRTDEEIKKQVQGRKQIGLVWQNIFIASLVIALIILLTLMVKIVNDSVGPIAVQFSVSPEQAAEYTGGRELTELSNEELVFLLEDNLRSSQLRNIKREANLPIDAPLDPSLFTQEELIGIIDTFIFQEEVVGSWTLLEGIFNYNAIVAEVAESNPNAVVRWNSWLTADFLTNTMSSTPANAGVRTALLGTIWIITVTMLFSVPLGVGAAIYLEEYAHSTKNPTLQRINDFIQTNINNLAGVPSIIYGILGLAVFVRALEPLTSGTAFGVADPTTANGRTILSGAFTLGLLILPLIIINAQEAIRAVPNSIRQASYGLGATKWQTIWNHVLPIAIPGVLTGTILAMSRAIGETAPLLVVGAATFITTDPDSIFSKFTVLPMQIYNWTAQPSDQFRNAAAAAIIVLLVILLSLNTVATLLRQHFRKNV